MRKLSAIGMIALLLLSSVAIPVSAAGNLNFSDDGQAPNPQFAVDSVTVDSWNNSEFDSPTEYYDDSGSAAELDAEVNRSDDPDEIGNGTVNPISLTATDIEVDAFGEFPRKSADGDQSDNTASALDASEWSTSGSASVSDVTTAPGVDAVQVTGSAGTDQSTYSNFSVTSDTEKRYIQLAADIDSASGTPTMYFNDSDGDYVAVDLYDSSADQSDDDVLANSTGEGHVIQVQVGELATQGTGDGTMGEITEITVQGDVTADFSLINAEKTSQYTFGERYVDDDGDLGTETIREPHGEYSVHSVDTFGSVMSDAVINGLSFPAHFTAELAPAEDVNATFKSDNAYPNWDAVADIYYKLSLPSAYDLSYSGVSLEQTTQWPGTRYTNVEYKEGVGDSEFSEIENWNSLTSSFDALDKDVTIDDTVSVDTEYAIHYEIKLTNDEASAMQSGGGMAPMGGSGGGGFLDWLIGLPGIAIAAVAGLAGRARGVF